MPRFVLILVKILKVLGEGGFSFVYLAEDEHSGVSAACYGLRCQLGLIDPCLRSANSP